MLVMYYIPYVMSQCNVMLKNNICNVFYIVLYFMSITMRCCPIQCYLFISVIIMSMREIYYKILNFFSFLYPNMYISSCIMCLHVYNLEVYYQIIKR